jgi:CYTH domain-containing protein
MRTKEEIAILLEDTESLIAGNMDIEADAYNYLIEWTEGVFCIDSTEGQRLFELCVRLLERIEP